MKRRTLLWLPAILIVAALIVLVVSVFSLGRTCEPTSLIVPGGTVHIGAHVCNYLDDSSIFTQLAILLPLGLLALGLCVPPARRGSGSGWMFVVAALVCLILGALTFLWVFQVRLNNVDPPVLKGLRVVEVLFAAAALAGLLAAPIARSLRPRGESSVRTHVSGPA